MSYNRVACECGGICGSCVSGLASAGCSGESPDCPNTLAVTVTIPAWTSSQIQCDDGGPLLDGKEYPAFSGTVTVTRTGTSGNPSCIYTGTVTPSVNMWYPNCVAPDYGSYETSREITVVLNRGNLELLSTWALADPCMIAADPTDPTTEEIQGVWDCGESPCNCKGIGVIVLDKFGFADVHGFVLGYNSGRAECGDDVPCYTAYGGSNWGIQSWWGRLVETNQPPQIPSVTIS